MRDRRHVQAVGLEDEAVGRNGGDVFDRKPANARDLLGDEGDVGGLVALAAMGDGRQVRAVGLEDEAVERRGGDGAAEGFSPSRTTSSVYVAWGTDSNKRR